MIKYKRIILKLSGEALANKDGTILNPEKLNVIAEAVKAMHEEGVEIGIVIGAGNIFRGKISSKIGVDRTNSNEEPISGVEKAFAKLNSWYKSKN